MDAQRAVGIIGFPMWTLRALGGKCLSCPKMLGECSVDVAQWILFKCSAGFACGISSDCENYFWCAGQNVRQAFSTLPDILRACQTFFPVDDCQISVAILVFLLGYFRCIELCWTKCPARSDLSVGHHLKSAGHVRHVRHISRSLLMISGVYRGWTKIWVYGNCSESQNIFSQCQVSCNNTVFYSPPSGS